ncbi:hypothetical protein V8G54_019744, partial [Vigna mungo]
MPIPRLLVIAVIHCRSRNFNQKTVVTDECPFSPPLPFTDNQRISRPCCMRCKLCHIRKEPKRKETTFLSTYVLVCLSIYTNTHTHICAYSLSDVLSSCLVF